jgi:hypothetical protein
MGYSLIVTESAKEESIKAFLWYESRKEGLGEEFFKELNDLYDYIEENPGLFPVKRKRIYHEAVVKRFPFVVVYAVNGSMIRVLSVFKTPQDPTKKP